MLVFGVTDRERNADQSKILSYWVTASARSRPSTRYVTPAQRERTRIPNIGRAGIPSIGDPAREGRVMEPTKSGEILFKESDSARVEAIETEPLPLLLSITTSFAA